MDQFKLADPRPLTSGGWLPWRQDNRPISEINPIGSMISEDEGRFLHWLTKEYFSDAGFVVDLGPLAGGSTFALALGLSENRRNISAVRIHSYDLWEFYEDWGRFFPGRHFNHRADIQGAFLQNLGPLGRYVAPHKGDICKAEWDRAPIEILFIDAAKIPDAMEQIVNEFYPALIPGRSIVVHQDFVSAECPWIHVIQEYLREYFEVVDSPDGGSVCFRPIREIPRKVLGKRNFYKELRTADGDELLQAAAGRAKGWYGLCVQAARAHFNAGRGNARLALKILEGINSSSDYVAAVKYDVDLADRAIKAH